MSPEHEYNRSQGLHVSIRVYKKNTQVRSPSHVPTNMVVKDRVFFGAGDFVGTESQSEGHDS